ncbi:MAG: tetratricopeptide repeat protein, partial [Caldimonas sp.]
MPIGIADQLDADATSPVVCSRLIAVGGRIVRSHCGAVVFALCALLAAPAQAEDREQARQSFKEGAQHFDLGEYKEALELFKQAYRQFEDPTFLFNIAQCYRLLGEKEQAVRLYRNYLAKVPEARNRDEVNHTIA